MENQTNSFQQYQMNSQNQDGDESKLNFQNILNNKFDYFNNKPSKYYNIAYYYYPEIKVVGAGGKSKEDGDV